MNRGQEFFNRLAERWDDLRAPDAGKLAALVEMTGIKAGSRILDVGCGTGVLLPYLKAAAGQSGEIIALDFAANMVARAEEKHRQLEGITYLAGDIYDFRCERRFDTIVCLNFFPHAHDKPAFLLNLRALLREGGTLAIMHDMSRAEVNAIHETNETVRNDRLPSGETVADMLRHAGYAVERVEDNDDWYFIKSTLAR
jgi:demethylmenaquinone methyltransferase/2-methoxy-6-polyprenyl-1,4-benzoquinol methylase